MARGPTPMYEALPLLREALPLYMALLRCDLNLLQMYANNHNLRPDPNPNPIPLIRPSHQVLYRVIQSRRVVTPLRISMDPLN